MTIFTPSSSNNYKPHYYYKPCNNYKPDYYYKPCNNYKPHYYKLHKN